MNPLRIVLSALLPLVTFLPFAACGGSGGLSSPSRQLLSVTISPAAVTAPATPPGQVQFVATGYYNTEPYTVTPLQATWGAAMFPQQVATVTQDGLASCAAGASGTTTVEAWVMLATNPMCQSIDSAGRPGCNNVGAAAQLTCP